MSRTTFWLVYTVIGLLAFSQVPSMSLFTIFVLLAFLLWPIVNIEDKDQ